MTLYRSRNLAERAAQSESNRWGATMFVWQEYEYGTHGPDQQWAFGVTPPSYGPFTTIRPEKT